MDVNERSDKLVGIPEARLAWAITRFFSFGDDDLHSKMSDLFVQR
jgi:hypothetical protein